VSLVAGDQIGYAGAQAVAAALMSNGILKWLNLTGTSATAAIAAVVDECLWGMRHDDE
jgi:hypothetical protein